ncbi:transposable element Tcb1 transposase [Trichonephila clavipes]|uniref:Transposable element Tcb1 transposase n=1 Tax=Trichonephila clavipes TaxID=2585209 RepID=A0A8X6SZX8_TRICX|nr:transposable element Tcb1 transposase [Trichonephila clavipes]
MSQDCFRHITTLPWPDRSLDLSPIKHIWDHLGWQAGQPTSLVELETRLQQPVERDVSGYHTNLYDSMFARIASCIRARGSPTEF